MTVAELIERLSQCDPAALVVMSKDGEGNNFSPLSDIDDTCKYVAETTWYGELVSPEDEEDEEPDLDEDRYLADEYEPTPAAVDCVVLWPVN